MASDLIDSLIRPYLCCLLHQETALGVQLFYGRGSYRFHPHFFQFEPARSPNEMEDILIFRSVKLPKTIIVQFVTDYGFGTQSLACIGYIIVQFSNIN